MSTKWLADAIRPNARAAVDELKAVGVEHLIMLTGDNKPTAEAVARQTGVDETRAELLREDKVKAVEELVSKYGSVAMIGDGVNDAPAMARASLGIAMGAAGTDAAIETADERRLIAIAVANSPLSLNLGRNQAEYFRFAGRKGGFRPVGILRSRVPLDRDCCGHRNGVAGSIERIATPFI